MKVFFTLLSVLILVMTLFSVWVVSQADEFKADCRETSVWSYSPSTKQCFLASNTCLPRGFDFIENAKGCDCDNLYILDKADEYRINSLCQLANE